MFSRARQTEKAARIGYPMGGSQVMTRITSWRGASALLKSLPHVRHDPCLPLVCVRSSLPTRRRHVNHIFD
jgi:hypothetical protein